MEILPKTGRQMARTQRTRLRAFLLLALGISLLLPGCRKNPARPNIVPPPAAIPLPSIIPPVPVPETWPELPLPPSRAPAPPEPGLPATFSDGEMNFLNGRYADAIRSYEKYLREDPITQYRETAMFRLALSTLLGCKSDDCRPRSLAASGVVLRRFLFLYPASSYCAEVRLILSLGAFLERSSAEIRNRDDKIKKLADELERLKKIDLERQPARKK
jgi:hypothetical protein